MTSPNPDSARKRPGFHLPKAWSFRKKGKGGAAVPPESHHSPPESHDGASLSIQIPESPSQWGTASALSRHSTPHDRPASRSPWDTTTSDIPYPTSSPSWTTGPASWAAGPASPHARAERPYPGRGNSHPAPGSARYGPGSLDELVGHAIAKYRERTGVDLSVAADELPDGSDDALVEFFERHKTNFAESRDRFPERVRKPLLALVKVLHPLCNVIGLGAALAPHGAPARVVFAGLELLLTAALDMHRDFEDIVKAFDRITEILARIRIVVCSETGTTDATQASAEDLRASIVNVLVEVLGVLAVIRTMTNARLKTWVKKLCQNKDVSDALDRLADMAASHDQMVSVITYQTTTRILYLLEQSGSRTLEEDMKDWFLTELKEEANRVNAGFIKYTTETRLLFEQVQASIDKGIEMQEMQGIFEWLQSSDPSLKFNKTLERRLHGTGSWFLAGRYFSHFKEGECSSLWLTGKSGMGKSSLAAQAITDIIEYCDSKPWLVPLYHFFDSTGSGPRDLRSLLGSLACQMISDDAASRPVLLDFYKEHWSGKRQPAMEALKSIVKRLLCARRPFRTPSRTYVVIDGLDESTNMREIISFLESLPDLDSGRVSILLTSRPEFTDAERVRKLFKQHVAMTRADVKNDISLLLDHALSDGGDLSAIPPHSRASIKKKLTLRADDSFVAATLLIDALKQCATMPSEVNRVLKIVPEIDAIYEDQLRLSSNQPPMHTKRLLTWMALDALGPVSTSLLLQLLSFNHTDPLHPEYYVDWQPSSIDAVIAAMGTAYLTKSKEAHDGQIYVIFTHASVKEWILQTPHLSEERRNCGLHVSSMFCAYIDCQPRVDLDSALCRSALDNWMRQFRLSRATNEPPATIVGHADAVAASLTKFFGANTDVLHLDHFGIASEVIPPEGPFTSLALASYSGRPDLVSLLLADRAKKWTPDQLSEALCCAPFSLWENDDDETRNLVAATVRLIIARDVDCNSTGRLICSTPLQYLCALGCRELVRVLIRQRADVNAWLDCGPPRDHSDATYASPITAPGLYKRLKKLERQLPAEDITAPGNSTRASEHSVSGNTVAAPKPRRRISYVPSLGQCLSFVEEDRPPPPDGFLWPIEESREPKLGLDRPGPPLWVASAFGYPDVVQLLIDSGANVNAVDKYGRSALQVAAINGHLDVVEVLLPHSVDDVKLMALVATCEAFDAERNAHATLMLLMHACSGFVDSGVLHALLLVRAFCGERPKAARKLAGLAHDRVLAVATYFLYFEDDSPIAELPYDWRRQGRTSLEHLVPSSRHEKIAPDVRLLRKVNPVNERA